MLKTQTWHFESARELFERIRVQAIECAKLEERVHELTSQQGPKGQTFEAIGRESGTDDGSAAMLRKVQVEEELERKQVALAGSVERACLVLYGKSGRGGLARLKDSATADCICGYYLMGMKWQELADEITKPESRDGKQWCKRKAYRGFECIDRMGTKSLCDT